MEDQSGKAHEEYIKTAKAIEVEVKDLATRIQNNELDLSAEPTL